MFNSVLLTGAAGALGRQLRPALRRAFKQVRLSDVAAVEPAGENEEVVPCDLRDAAAVEQLVSGMDAIVHFGGSLSRNDWGSVMEVNIAGTYNLYEAARRQNVLRVVYASSNHVIGMYPRSEQIDLDAPLRPDSLYGVSKCFGEALSRYYWDKYGIESACLRIGSALAKPNDERSLATWLSLEDLDQLVLRCLTTPHLGWTALYGVSDNDRSWWDNGKAGYVGFRPRDNAESFAVEVTGSASPLDPADPAVFFQGGARSSHDYVDEAARAKLRRERQPKP
ncbi:NAD(P)-dependent oxidoreductase [Bosea caraganae]|uniref:NAD(P)-dependent oxidoreductase n=1 Tax=Bosea caraganae TaxID=2763117 RepID=A0A370L5M9_9HYPH|nr:NAD(P)-dependent oxidoreductase [Bosea caraganae]RDJ24278.1 NAD(P)-dependent oxidoreductase [Bosea caraganae]RDJ30320.1 NAD(P)-dependent oxidoreductase [Bosea caraganae]